MRSKDMDGLMRPLDSELLIRKSKRGKLSFRHVLSVCVGVCGQGLKNHACFRKFGNELGFFSGVVLPPKD